MSDQSCCISNIISRKIGDLENIYVNFDKFAAVKKWDQQVSLDPTRKSLTLFFDKLL